MFLQLSQLPDCTWPPDSRGLPPDGKIIKKNYIFLRKRKRQSVPCCLKITETVEEICIGRGPPILLSATKKM
jgi:hypothetical protein